MSLKKITPQSLVCMDDCAKEGLLRVECAYARTDNFLFQERIYREEAKIWLHETLAQVVILAARKAMEKNLRLVLYDGLRTIEAQEKMLHTHVVKNNPHWLEEPRLLSPPGAGAHPRGMAIDVSLETHGGALLDMGTPFDFLAENPAPAYNLAHREYPHNASVMENRALLDSLLCGAAQALKTPLLPLPQEWWDYRLPPNIYNLYAPLSDTDLPPEMRMVGLDS